jgi:hypothetical protein
VGSTLVLFSFLFGWRRDKHGSRQIGHRSFSETLQKLHRSFTEALQKLYRSFTEALQKLHRSFTETLQKLHRSFTEALHKLHRNFCEASVKLFLKATIHRTVFLCKLESFAGAVMQIRFRRTCPLCGRPDFKNISTHLLQVHGLQSKERKPYLKQANLSPWQPYIGKSPYMNSEKQGEKRVSRRAYSLPTKKPKTAQASLTTKPYPEFNFRHKFSLLVVGPSQSGKTYFVQQILENNRIVYDEKNVFVFFGTTTSGKIVTTV